MDQIFMCACCGGENDILLDPSEGAKQEMVQDCAVCCRPNVIRARYNDHSNEFDLDIYVEDVG